MPAAPPLPPCPGGPGGGRAPRRNPAGGRVPTPRKAVGRLPATIHQSPPPAGPLASPWPGGRPASPRACAGASLQVGTPGRWGPGPFAPPPPFQSQPPLFMNPQPRPGDSGSVDGFPDTGKSRVPPRRPNATPRPPAPAPRARQPPSFLPERRPTTINLLALSCPAPTRKRPAHPLFQQPQRPGPPAPGFFQEPAAGVPARPVSPLERSKSGPGPAPGGPPHRLRVTRVAGRPRFLKEDRGPSPFRVPRTSGPTPVPWGLVSTPAPPGSGVPQPGPGEGLLRFNLPFLASTQWRKVGPGG